MAKTETRTADLGMQVEDALSAAGPRGRTSRSATDQLTAMLAQSIGVERALASAPRTPKRTATAPRARVRKLA